MGAIPGLPIPGLPLPAEGLEPRWYFTVGPTQMHPAVPRALRAAVADGLPSWNHRGGKARKETAATVAALRALLGIPEEHRVFFLGSATEAMERLAEGVIGVRSHHLVNGAFSKRFLEVARNLGRDSSGERVPEGQGFDLAGVRVPGGTELLALAQNETSTGVALDPAGIAGLSRRNPGVLVAVDTVTAAPIQPLDLSAVDASFFSVQKLFGLPAGLSVLTASPALVERARERMGGGSSVGGYLHLPALAEAADRDEAVATPNLLGMHLLRRIAEDYLARGIERLRTETVERAQRITAAADRAGWEPFPPCPADRSGTILVFRAPGAADWIRHLSALGFEISTGYGAHRKTSVRIGNFPVHPAEAVEALARAIEGGLPPGS